MKKITLIGCIVLAVALGMAFLSNGCGKKETSFTLKTGLGTSS